MDLKGLEQEVKIAATHYFYASGDKSKMMESLLNVTTRYLEDGGTSEHLHLMLSKEKER